MTDQTPSLPPLSEAEERKIRILKAVVVILGILIVVTLLGLVGGMVYNANKEESKAETKTVIATETAPVSLPSGDLQIDLPSGAIIQETRVNGNQMTLRWKHPDSSGEQAIWLIDLKSGAVVKKIRITNR